MKIQNMQFSYKSNQIYKDFTIEFPTASVTAILGPSGCGKTTLLNILAFNKANHVSYIFQEPRLLPWYTICKNLYLVNTGTKSERVARSRMYLEKVGLLNRASAYPSDLSGGERQRVSIARAFSYTSPVLLMDEPFQSQDPATKLQLIDVVKKLQVQEKRTMVAVTHDINEASAFADRAVVLGGRPVQILLDIPRGANFERTISEALEWAKKIT